MQKKLVIFDLDDTLLNNSSEVSDYTLDILKRVQKSGHFIAFNTARSQMRSEEIFNIVKPDYAIYNGGAQITDRNGKTIYEAAVDKAVCNALVPELFALTDRFSYQNADWFYSANADYNAPDVKFFDFKNEEFPTGAYKIIAFSDNPESLVPVAEKYDLDFITYFGGPFCRFTKKGVTKASGNRALAEIVGVVMDDIIAFGDDTGDIGMLMEAGVGVIMKNAKDHLKTEGLTVSEFTNDEDGVARFLSNHLELD